MTFGSVSLAYFGAMDLPGDVEQVLARFTLDDLGGRLGQLGGHDLLDVLESEFRMEPLQVSVFHVDAQRFEECLQKTKSCFFKNGLGQKISLKRTSCRSLTILSRFVL